MFQRNLNWQFFNLAVGIIS